MQRSTLALWRLETTVPRTGLFRAPPRSSFRTFHTIPPPRSPAPSSARRNPIPLGSLLGLIVPLCALALWKENGGMSVVYADSEVGSGMGGRGMIPVVGMHKTELPISETIDPATSISHPTRLSPSLTSPSSSLPSPVSTASPLTLIGLGVRTVSFLRVKVYSVGFYLEEVALAGLGGLQGWDDGGVRAGEDAGLGERLRKGGEGMMRRVVELPVVCAVRIVPTRTTDFGHLRDGFTRALLARQKAGNKDGSIKAEEDERISASIQSFKAIFPRESVPKGGELLMIKTVDGCLGVEYEGKVLGKVADPWVAKEMILAYFADDNVISAALKESVATGFERLLRKTQ